MKQRYRDYFTHEMDKKFMAIENADFTRHRIYTTGRMKTARTSTRQLLKKTEKLIKKIDIRI